jgi:hypothetical protein
VALVLKYRREDLPATSPLLSLLAHRLSQPRRMVLKCSEVTHRKFHDDRDIFLR